jgi:SAM-dependent methyltransferase
MANAACETPPRAIDRLSGRREPSRESTPDDSGPPPAGPQALALPGVHETAQRLLFPLPRGRLVDLAAGQGALSLWASHQGFEVTAVDVAAGNFHAPGIPFRQADLNGRFPFDDNSVDVVVALEIIEHLENQFGFLREIARVLKPGGHAVVSTPNEHNLQSRWAYFLTGFYGDSRTVLQADDPELPMKHINMMPPCQLELAWRMAGLELVTVDTNRYRRFARWLLPLVYPLQRLCYGLRLRHTKDPQQRETASRAYRLLNRPALLLGRVVAFQLRKPCGR